MGVSLKGIKDNARNASVQELNARLADGIALALAIKQAHWNVKGPNFIAVHELFDQIRARVDLQNDTMAERVQQLDGVAIGTADEIAKASSLPAYPTDLTKSADHLREIAGLLRAHGEKIRNAIDVTDDAGDADTADIFTGISRDLDKDLWFVESHLE